MGETEEYFGAARAPRRAAPLRHASTRRAVTTAALVAGLLVAVACGRPAEVLTTGPDGFAATPEYLDTVVDASTSDSYRWEMWMTLGDTEPTGAPMIVGAVESDRSATSVDTTAGMETLNASALDELGPGATIPSDEFSRYAFDLVMVGADDAYLRFPFLDDAPDHLLDPDTRTLRDLVAETEGWMLVHPSQMDVIDPDTVTVDGATGETQEIDALLQTVANAESADELGQQELRGDTAFGIRAEVSFEDLLAAEGVDPEAYVEEIVMLQEEMMAQSVDAKQLTPAEREEHRGAITTVMLDLTVPTEVWVDRNGLLRRFSYSLDLAQIVQRMAEHIDGLDVPRGAAAFGPQMHVTADLFDHGEALDIEVPPDAVDLTDGPELFDPLALIAIADKL